MKLFIADAISAVMEHHVTQTVLRYWPIFFRASLYFIIAALPSWVKATNDFGLNSKPTNGWIMTSVVCESIYQGCVGLRAYFDGSSVRLMPHSRNETNHPKS